MNAIDILAAEEPIPPPVVIVPPHAGHTVLGNVVLSAIGTAVGGLLLYGIMAVGRAKRRTGRRSNA